MLVSQSTSPYLPRWAYSAGKYGSIVLADRERSAHVEGREIGVSWETISQLTPLCQRMAFIPPSICCGNPSTLSTVGV